MPRTSGARPAAVRAARCRPWCRLNLPTFSGIYAVDAGLVAGGTVRHNAAKGNQQHSAAFGIRRDVVGSELAAVGIFGSRRALLKERERTEQRECATAASSTISRP